MPQHSPNVTPARASNRSKSRGFSSDDERMIQYAIDSLRRRDHGVRQMLIDRFGITSSREQNEIGVLVRSEFFDEAKQKLGQALEEHQKMTGVVQ